MTYQCIYLVLSCNKDFASIKINHKCIQSNTADLITTKQANFVFKLLNFPNYALYIIIQWRGIVKTPQFAELVVTH